MGFAVCSCSCIIWVKNKPDCHSVLVWRAESEVSVSSITQTSDGCLFFSGGDDEEEIISQDTDSDVAEQRDGVKVKVKWTQEEVTADILLALFND